MNEIKETNKNKNTAVACADAKASAAIPTKARKPQYRVEKKEDAYQIEVALPGAAKSGIGIAIEKGVLTVTAERAADLPEDWKALLRETVGGSYRLDLQLNAPVDEAAIEAKAEDGILKLTLPIKEEAKAKKIEVQ